jgi:hypothetical protein
LQTKVSCQDKKILVSKLETASFTSGVSGWKQFAVHGEPVIILRNNSPRFSSSQVKEIRKMPYSFSYFNGSKAGPQSMGGWAIDMIYINKKGLMWPNVPRAQFL